MKYSIVIVTYNRCSLLKECVACAMQQTQAASHIIIIDNASTDETDDYLKNLNRGTGTLPDGKEYRRCGRIL